MELKAVIRCLEQIGVSGYSVIRNVIGKGDRGPVGEEEELDLLGNDYILTICSVEKETAIMAAMHPLLQRYGGICISSDAKWLVHDNALW